MCRILEKLCFDYECSDCAAIYDEERKEDISSAVSIYCDALENVLAQSICEFETGDPGAVERGRMIC